MVLISRCLVLSLGEARRRNIEGEAMLISGDVIGAVNDYRI